MPCFCVDCALIGGPDAHQSRARRAVNFSAEGNNAAKKAQRVGAKRGPMTGSAKFGFRNVQAPPRVSLSLTQATERKPMQRAAGLVGYRARQASSPVFFAAPGMPKSAIADLGGRVSKDGAAPCFETRSFGALLSMRAERCCRLSERGAGACDKSRGNPTRLHAMPKPGVGAGRFIVEARMPIGIRFGHPPLSGKGIREQAQSAQPRATCRWISGAVRARLRRPHRAGRDQKRTRSE
jgi:hypothetical protein